MKFFFDLQFLLLKIVFFCKLFISLSPCKTFLLIYSFKSTQTKFSKSTTILDSVLNFLFLQHINSNQKTCFELFVLGDWGRLLSASYKIYFQVWAETYPMVKMTLQVKPICILCRIYLRVNTLKLLKGQGHRQPSVICLFK